ncbi:multiple ankyrin repeats single kh domain protein [Rutstroemia sp. NJR-2017a BBW]|nr:multiple ankyrin repeats single kh domain protein [Rutstroemia sp. NJR-2017a BBW]
MSDASLRVMIPNFYSRSSLTRSEDFAKVMERTFCRLRDVMPQQHDEDVEHVEYITDILRNLVSDNLHGNTLAFLNLAVFLLSNNLLEDEVADRINDGLFQWLKQDENHSFLRFILCNKMPTIDAFIEGIYASAIRAGNLAVVRIMLEGGLNPDILIRGAGKQPVGGIVYRYTPLQYAALERNYELAELLLNYGAHIHALKDVERPYGDSKPPCSWAFECFDSAQTPLQLAAYSSSIEIAKLLISRGAAINVPYSCGATALQNSIMARNLEITYLLLENGADIDASFGNYNCPLACAISTGQMDLFCDLLNRGAQVDPTNQYQKINLPRLTPLQCAVMMQEYEAVTELLQRGANVNAPAHETGGRTALQCAAEQGDLKLCKLLLDAHANPNGSPASESDPDLPAVTALSAAVSSGKMEIVKLLLASGAKILYNRYGETTVLEMATSLNDIEMVGFLLAQNPAASRDRSIFIATRLQNRELIKLLLGARADINKVGYGGINVLSIAVCSNDTEFVKLRSLPMVELLLYSGADYDCPWIKHDKHEMELEIFRLATYAPLAAAAQMGNIQIVHRLLAAGASVNSPTSSPTVLQAAVKSGDIDLVQLFISIGAEVNAASAESFVGCRTALQTAVYKRDITLVKLLLDAGANANDGRHGVMTLAARSGNTEILRLLLENGATINDPLTENHTPLQAAAKGGHHEIVKFLLELGADVHAPAVMDYGVTALQGAVMSGSMRMAKYLIKNGADVAAPGSKRGSAVEIAAEYGRLDMLKLLLLQKPKITGTWRVQYESAMKIATDKGHDAAAKLLKYHQVL